jgi:hypothetical protein
MGHIPFCITNGIRLLSDTVCPLAVRFPQPTPTAFPEHLPHCTLFMRVPHIRPCFHAPQTAKRILACQTLRFSSKVSKYAINPKIYDVF